MKTTNSTSFANVSKRRKLTTTPYWEYVTFARLNNMSQTPIIVMSMNLGEGFAVVRPMNDHTTGYGRVALSYLLEY